VPQHPESQAMVGTYGVVFHEYENLICVQYCGLEPTAFKDSEGEHTEGPCNSLDTIFGILTLQ
jgi:hypothetical protein